MLWSRWKCRWVARLEGRSGARGVFSTVRKPRCDIGKRMMRISHQWRRLGGGCSRGVSVVYTKKERNRKCKF